MSSLQCEQVLPSSSTLPDLSSVMRFSIEPKEFKDFERNLTQHAEGINGEVTNLKRNFESFKEKLDLQEQNLSLSVLNMKEEFKKCRIESEARREVLVKLSEDLKLLLDRKIEVAEVLKTVKEEFDWVEMGWRKMAMELTTHNKESKEEIEFYSNKFPEYLRRISCIQETLSGLLRMDGPNFSEGIVNDDSSDTTSPWIHNSEVQKEADATMGTACMDSMKNSSNWDRMSNEAPNSGDGAIGMGCLDVVANRSFDGWNVHTSLAALPTSSLLDSEKNASDQKGMINEAPNAGGTMGIQCMDTVENMSIDGCNVQTSPAAQPTSGLADFDKNASYPERMTNEAPNAGDRTVLCTNTMEHMSIDGCDVQTSPAALLTLSLPDSEKNASDQEKMIPNADVTMGMGYVDTVENMSVDGCNVQTSPAALPTSSRPDSEKNASDRMINEAPNAAHFPETAVCDAEVCAREQAVPSSTAAVDQPECEIIVVSSDCSSSDSDNESENDESISDTYMNNLVKNVGQKKKVWRSAADMLSGFGKDPELCMRAVCAMYRRTLCMRKSVTNPSVPSSLKLSQFNMQRVKELAEFLINGDEKLRLKKTVAEVERACPKALEICKDLAIGCHERLFEILCKGEDPFF